MAGARLWIVNGVLIVLALVGVLAVVLGLTTHASSNAATLRTVPVGRGTVTETVTASGTVTSATSSTLNFSTSGKIATVRVQLGDKVTAGETVATLDGQYAQANLTAARAQLTSARKQLSNAIDARDNPSTTTSGTGATGTTGTAGGGATGGAATGTGTTGTGTGGTGTGGTGTGTGKSGGGSSGGGTSGSGTSGTGASWLASPSSGLVEQTPTPTPSPSGSGTTGTTGTTGSSSSTSSANSAQAAVDSARASVDQAQASVIQAQQGTDNLDLVSPQDGTVVSLDAVAGQVVGGQGIVTSSTGNGNPSGGALPNGSSASSGATAGGSASSSSGAAGASGASGSASSGSSVTAAPSAAAVMTVADLGSLQVKANIPELDVGRVATGLPTTISVNALPGQTENGSVASVDVLPGSGTSVQYGTAIGFTTPPPGLRPGMSASVSIDVASASDTPFLPSVAVSPVGGAGSTTATVQVLGPDGKAQQRTVGIGLTSDATTQVTSGLAAGDLVVLPDPTGTDSFRRGGQQQGSSQSSGSSSSSGR